MRVTAVMGALATGRTGGWVWDPAGPDELLARACTDLKAGRFGLASEALVGCGADFAARSRRSALLASVAAGVDAADHWLAEDPKNPDALLLAARVAVLRARRAQPRDLRLAGDLADLAEELCFAAARANPRDPTPWVALLALRKLTGGRESVAEGRALYEERNGVGAGGRTAGGRRWNEQVAEALTGGWGPSSRQRRPAWYVPEALADTLVAGPWSVMFEVWARDPLSREGHHRFLDCLSVQDAHQFAALIAEATAPSAAVQLLPLAAHLADYRYRSRRGRSNDLLDQAGAVWQSPALQLTCLELYSTWFLPRYKAREPVAVADYALLAHALFMAGESTWSKAASVIEAMKPFAATHPWSLTAANGDGAHAFAACARALHVEPPHWESAWEYREKYRNP